MNSLPTKKVFDPCFADALAIPAANGSRARCSMPLATRSALRLIERGRWNGRADDLASEGIAKDHQSAEYASFHERMKSIDWKTEDEEILRAVAEAVANLPPPTTTND